MPGSRGIEPCSWLVSSGTHRPERRRVGGNGSGVEAWLRDGAERLGHCYAGPARPEDRTLKASRCVSVPGSRQACKSARKSRRSSEGGRCIAGEVGCRHHVVLDDKRSKGAGPQNTGKKSQSGTAELGIGNAGQGCETTDAKVWSLNSKVKGSNSHIKIPPSRQRKRQHRHRLWRRHRSSIVNATFNRQGDGVSGRRYPASASTRVAVPRAASMVSASGTVGTAQAS